MPERIANAKKLRLVVCVDEFRHMINWHDDLKAQKLMRAHWQRHKHVTYVLYGSKRHIMMAGLFDHGGMPFYRFGDIIWLERIALEHWTPWLVEHFRSSGNSIAPKLAETLARTVGCHSWYVQQLAHFLWSHTRRKADSEGLEGALNLVIDAGTPLYRLLCEGLSATAINLLKAIANVERQLTSAAVMHEHRLGTPRHVQKTREALEQKDIIDRTPEGYSFLDPVLELWFKREFLRKQVRLAE